MRKVISGCCVFLMFFVLVSASWTQQKELKQQRHEKMRQHLIQRVQEEVGERVRPERIEKYVEMEMARIEKKEALHEARMKERREAYVSTQKRVLAKGVVASVAAVDVQDSLALVALYHSTNGDSWTNNTNWLVGPVNTWYGVVVERDTVVAIKLGDNGLNGPIPAALGGVTYLRELELFDNWLTGNIPPELGQLTRLQVLNLNKNGLSGPIPATLGQLASLTFLGLWDNWLAGAIPVELGNLLNLRELDLYDNMLTGSIPAALGNLSNLQYLYLGWNDLSGVIPVELANLTQLLELLLNGNDLSGGIPAALGNLVNLEYLWLAFNPLTGNIPIELANLVNLQELWLAHNQLTGSIPVELGNLLNLTYFGLYVNQLTGPIPVELGNLVNLTDLSLSSNQLTGGIPAALGNLVNLEHLYLGSNGLTGSVPSELGNLVNLIELDFTFNQLTGSIPAALGNLVNLEYLGFWVNQLSGPIPNELGNMASLRTLDLDDNQLSGSVPASFVNLLNLRTFYMSNNLIDGLPDLHALFGSFMFWFVNGNRLTFEDLEPNISIWGFWYAPQDSVETHGVVLVDELDPLSLSVTVGGTANQYQWFKDDVPIAGATAAQYTVANTPVAASGVYRCEITNTIATALTLYSRMRRVVVRPVPIIAVAPEHHDFGEHMVGGDTTKVFTIYNIGSADLTLHALSLCGADSASFGLNGLVLPRTIRAQWHVELTVHFAPDAPGPCVAALKILSNAISRPDLRVPLTGAGTVPDTAPPQLARAFPLAEAQAVPVNGALFWQLEDSGTGVDTASVNVTVNGTPVVTGGVDVSGGCVEMATCSHGLHVKYRPDPGFTGQSTVTVQVTAQDLAPIPNLLDSSYVFNVGAATVTTCVVDTADTSACVIVDDSSSIEMIIPEHALSEETEIMISEAENVPALPDSVSGLGLNVHFWPDGLQFDVPVTLCIPYTQATLDSAGVSDPMDLAVYYFSSTSGQWTQLTVLDSNATQVMVEITEFCYLSLASIAQQSTAVPADDLLSTPKVFTLAQNYPNPFNPETHIAFTTAVPGEVSLTVYDVRGKAVRLLRSAFLNAGRHDAVWQGRDDSGNTVASGVYFYVLRCGDQVLRRKCVFMK